MSAPACLPHFRSRSRFAHLRTHLPTVAASRWLRCCKPWWWRSFVLTFVLQPLLIPSESMERTLLVGDFLLFNKQVYAPAGRSAAGSCPIATSRAATSRLPPLPSRPC